MKQRDWADKRFELGHIVLVRFTLLDRQLAQALRDRSQVFQKEAHRHRAPRHLEEESAVTMRNLPTLHRLQASIPVTECQFRTVKVVGRGDIRVSSA